MAKTGIIFDIDAVNLNLDEYIEKTLFVEPKQDLCNGQCWHLFGVSSYAEKKIALESFLESKLFCLPVSKVSEAAHHLSNSFPRIFSYHNVPRLNTTSSSKSLEISNTLLDRIYAAMDLDTILFKHSCMIYNFYCSHLTSTLSTIRPSISKRLSGFLSRFK